MTNRVSLRRGTAAFTAALLASLGAASSASAATSSYDTITGQLLPVEIDTPGSPDQEQHVITTPDGQVVSVDLPASLEGLQPGTEVTARVVTSGDDEPAEVLSARVSAGAVAPSVTPLNHNAYVVTIDDPTVAGDITPSQAQQMTQRTTSYWVAESHSAIPTFTNAPVRTVTQYNSCAMNYTALWELGRTQWSGVNFNTPGNHLIVYSPTSCAPSYPYAGVASVGAGIHSGGMIHIVSALWSTVAHEVGHNLSLGHANVETPNGASHEYYGVYGPQAFSVGGIEPAGMLDGAYEEYLGLASIDGQHQDVPWGTQGSFVMQQVGAPTGITTLTFTDPNGSRHFIEYRSCGLRDAGTLCSVNPGAQIGTFVIEPGVVVTRLDGTDVTYLASPSGPTFDTSYGAGQTFTAVDGLWSVTVGSINGASAFVTLDLNSTGVAEGPVASITRVSVADVLAGQTPRANVRVSSARGGDGLVDIAVNGELVGPVHVEGGTGSINLPDNLSVGTHTVTANFLGSDAINPSTASTTFVVLSGDAGSAVTVTAPPVKFGTPAEITVEVASAAGTPTGIVDLFREGQRLGSVALLNGRAAYRLPATLEAGAHTITAQYKGGGGAAPGTGTAVLIIVAPPAPGVTISSPPTTYGTPAQITVQVTAPTSPRGTVELYRDTQKVTDLTLVAGRATYSLPSTLSAGTYTMKAIYAGNVDVGPGEATSTLVIEGPAVSTVTVSSPTVAYRKAAVLDIAVDASVPATGSVKVYQGSTLLGSANLVNSRATYILPTTLNVGTVPITVKYPGSIRVAPSNGNGVVTVTKANAFISAKGSNLVAGLRGTVTVTAEALDGLSPTGKVTVLVNGTPVSSATTLAASGARRVATVTTSPLTTAGEVTVLFESTNGVINSGTFATGLSVVSVN